MKLEPLSLRVEEEAGVEIECETFELFSEKFYLLRYMSCNCFLHLQLLDSVLIDLLNKESLRLKLHSIPW